MANFNKATGYSHTKRDSCDFKWAISDYMLVFARENAIESPVISVGSDKFQLILRHGTINFTGRDEASRSLTLRVLEITRERSSVKYEISVIKDGKIVDTQTDYLIWNSRNTTILQLRLADMKKFVSSADTLIFHIKLIVSTDSVMYSPSRQFNNRPFCDAVLNTSGSNIPAHRRMLAAASPVFRALFSQDDTFLKKIEIVNMKDVSYETAEEMLRFIYTGTIESREVTLIIDLLATADKYQLEELKNECERILSSLLPALP